MSTYRDFVPVRGQVHCPVCREPIDIVIYSDELDYGPDTCHCRESTLVAEDHYDEAVWEAARDARYD